MIPRASTCARRSAKPTRALCSPTPACMLPQALDSHAILDSRATHDSHASPLACTNRNERPSLRAEKLGVPKKLQFGGLKSLPRRRDKGDNQFCY